jgi:hypothetical protein
MMAHVVGMLAAIAAIILCMVLPFLPGRYDSLAAPLSLMAQIFGVVGLLLVPVGACWMVAEYRSRTAPKRYGFAIGALIAGSLVWALVTLGATVESIALGVASLMLWVSVITAVLRRVRSARNAAPAGRSAVPVYLIVVPMAVALIQPAVAGPVTEWSRSRAIRNSEALIADIERYRAVHGRYPVSLVGLWPDYWPSIIGIRQYIYEPHGDAYNLLFEAVTFRFGTREIVMFNPRDEHAIVSHAAYRLELTPSQLETARRQGHYAVHDAPHPHWKYFWFD